MKVVTALVLILLSVNGFAQSTKIADQEVIIRQTTYKPFLKEAKSSDVRVESYAMDRDLVTNSDYLTFVLARPEWSRSKVKRIFADSEYLKHWADDGAITRGTESQPVTNVSWFAARAYCKAQGKRLPTIAEWESAADPQNIENLRIIMEWYGRPNGALTDVQKASVNRNGVRGMHGLVWEWVEDFNSSIIGMGGGGSSQSAGSTFCGGAALKANSGEYATYMRFAHRSSLKAASVGDSLGFRCVR